jgi:hypothetical protein
VQLPYLGRLLGCYLSVCLGYRNPNAVPEPNRLSLPLGIHGPSKSNGMASPYRSHVVDPTSRSYRCSAWNVDSHVKDDRVFSDRILRLSIAARPYRMSSPALLFNARSRLACSLEHLAYHIIAPQPDGACRWLIPEGLLMLSTTLLLLPVSTSAAHWSLFTGPKRRNQLPYLESRSSVFASKGYRHLHVVMVRLFRCGQSPREWRGDTPDQPYGRRDEHSPSITP